jgi:hypothetical protein
VMFQSLHVHFVILSEAKDLARRPEMLRYTQHDRNQFQSTHICDILLKH